MILLLITVIIPVGSGFRWVSESGSRKAKKNLRNFNHNKKFFFHQCTFYVLFWVKRNLRLGPDSQHCYYTVQRQDTTLKIWKNIPRKEIARPQSQFQHSCVCEWFIYSHDWSAYSAAVKYVDRSWKYVYNRSQTHECGNWDWCRAIPFLGTHTWDFRCSAVGTVHPLTVGTLPTTIAESSYSSALFRWTVITTLRLENEEDWD